MSSDLVIVKAMPPRSAPRPRPLRPEESLDLNGKPCRHRWENFRNIAMCMNCAELSHQDGTVLSWREVHQLVGVLRSEQRVIDQREEQRRA